MKQFFKIVFGSCLGFALAFVVITFFGIFLINSLVSDASQTGAVDIPEKTVLTLNFADGFTERKTEETPLDMLSGGTPLHFFSCLQAIEKAATDERVEALAIFPGSGFVSASRMGDLEQAIQKFAAQKPVYAYFSAAGNAQYGLAALADSIFMPPTNSARLSLSGYNVSLPYFKEGFDKLGIQFQVIHVGKYKGAYENFARESMSEEFESEYRKVLDDLFERRLQWLAAQRNINVATLQNWIESGDVIDLTPDKAHQLGLIDGLLTQNQFYAKFDIDREDFVSIDDYSKTVYQKPQFGQKKIAVIAATGEIRMEKGRATSSRKEILDANTYVRSINQAADDDDVAVILLRVDSPGGSALASEHILQAIQAAQEKKPVIVSMASVAASGGYYISCQADKIFADPNTITGSIGVVGMLPQGKTLLETHLGVHFEQIKRGRYTDMGNISRPLTAEERALIRESMESIYSEFKGRVHQGRKIDMDQLEEIAQGKIWTGVQALENGLIDSLGGFYEALQAAATMMEAETMPEMVWYPKQKSFIDQLLEGDFSLMGKLPFLQATDVIPEELEPIFLNYERARYYQGQPLMLMLQPIAE